MKINGVIKEFDHLLEYHTRKLNQLIKLRGNKRPELEAMLNVIRRSRQSFLDSPQLLPDIKNCISAIKTGQQDFKDLSKVLPIQVEILYEMDLFLMRHDIK